MNITFDPTVATERTAVLTLLGLLEGTTRPPAEPTLPAGCVQQTIPETAEEKPKRTRRTKEQIAADEAREAETKRTDAKELEKKLAEGAAGNERAAADAKAEADAAIAKDRLAKEHPRVDPSMAMQKGEDLFGDEAAGTTAKTWTKEELRAMLTQCAEDPKRGADKARAIMREHGKADRLSDIQPAFYAAVAAALGA